MNSDDYIQLVHNNPDHQNFVVINWCMGNTCNFSCSYCPDGLHDGSKSWYDFETVQQFCEKTIEHYSNLNKKIYFEFTGGEVTLWKHFKDLCVFLKKHNVKVGLISNGSRTERYWEELLPLIDHVCLSFHPEHADETHFIKIVKMASQKVRTHVNIMMKPEQFNRCYEVAAKVKNIKNISMALQPLIVDFGNDLYEYTDLQKNILDKQYELLIKHIQYDREFESYRGAMKIIRADGTTEAVAPQKFIANNTNSWYGWSCNAGLEQIVIDMTGDIYRGWCKVGGKVGNLLDIDLELPTSPIICNKFVCHCNFDIMATKEKV